MMSMGPDTPPGVIGELLYSLDAGKTWSKTWSLTDTQPSPSGCSIYAVHGYPWWDALAGEVQDRVEVLTSTDDGVYASQGFLQTDLRWKDLPVNHIIHMKPANAASISVMGRCPWLEFFPCPTPVSNSPPVLPAQCGRYSAPLC